MDLYDPSTCSITPDEICMSPRLGNTFWGAFGFDPKLDRTAYVLVLKFRKDGWGFDRTFTKDDLNEFVRRNQDIAPRDLDGLDGLVAHGYVIEGPAYMGYRLTKRFVMACYEASQV